MRIKRAAAVALFILATSMSLFATPSVGVVTGRALLSTTALKPGADFKLALVYTVQKGYHIGAASPKALYPAKLELNPPAGVTFDKPRFPRETLKAFSFSDGGKLAVYEGVFTIFVDGHVAKNAKIGPRTVSSTLVYQACNVSTCSMPAKVTVSLSTRVAGPAEKTAPANRDVFPQKSSSTGGLFSRGWALGFLGIFALGVGLCLTPCVYPMVPVTIGYFGMQSHENKSRLMLLAGVYVVGIAVTYSILGMLAAAAGKNNMFGSVLQKPYVPLGIAAVLVVLALSMFGLYELRPPAWLAAKSQGRSGPIGALLMGLLFGIVAAPCVGPVTVSLLVLVTSVGKPIFGFLTFFVLALGMGLPLFALAMFSGSIQRLPQAGMWMVSVKKVFGMLLIGAALYYVTPLVRLHISDMVADRLLPVFIMATGLYVGWLEPGLRKLPQVRQARKVVGVAVLVIGLSQLPNPSAKADRMDFQPYTEAAVAQAARDGKPVMIDFAASWCAECKELDTRTFPADDVTREGKRFVRLRADLTDGASNKADFVQVKYKIQGLPTVVFLDHAGNEVTDARVVGFVDAKDMAARMSGIR
jgi:thioredoxin:protein disulfide reductase